MPTALRWGPYRAFFYSNEAASLRMFMSAAAEVKPNSGFMT
ncbi:MAG TPA: hypothetical protein VM867_04605 [Xanthobacteraceae bacterium]|nr:hypothetical protein [Xanthobacteraceae bacterium]